jgi:hypothetical protein
VHLGALPPHPSTGKVGFRRADRTVSVEIPSAEELLAREACFQGATGAAIPRRAVLAKSHGQGNEYHRHPERRLSHGRILWQCRSSARKSTAADNLISNGFQGGTTARAWAILLAACATSPWANSRAATWQWTT